MKIYANGIVGFVDKKKVIMHSDWIDKFKVLTQKASEGKGDFPNKIIGKPVITDNNSCCTETYLVVGMFEDKVKAINLLNYMKTRFFRFLVSMKKNTQDVNQSKFSFVPYLDMSIEWTDEILYTKYKLTSEEIDFIASIVKEM